MLHGSAKTKKDHSKQGKTVVYTIWNMWHKNVIQKYKGNQNTVMYSVGVIDHSVWMKEEGGSGHSSDSQWVLSLTVSPLIIPYCDWLRASSVSLSLADTPQAKKSDFPPNWTGVGPWYSLPQGNALKEVYRGTVCFLSRWNVSQLDSWSCWDHGKRGA